MADEQTKKQGEQAGNEEEAKLTVNVVSVEDSGTLKKKLKVEVPREEIDKRLNENFTEVMRTVQVPGFRLGRAPRKLIEKRFGKDIRDQVKLNLVAGAVERAVEETKLQTLGDPDLKFDAITLPDEGSLVFEFEVEVHPEFDLPKLEGIEVTEKDIPVTEKDIDDQIENYRWQMANLQEVAAGGSTEKNDHIEADSTFEVGGEPPTVKHDSPLDLRPQAIEGVMFNDLGDQLAGLKIGDSKTVEVTVPDTHTKEAWRGKTAKLVVTVKKIFRWILPEMSEDLAKQFGFTSISNWRETVKTELEARKGQQARKDLEEQIEKYLLDNVKIEIPEGVAERQTNRALMRRVLELQQMGIPPVLIEQQIDDLRARVRTQAMDDLRLSFIFNKIGRQYEIKVDEEEVNGMIASIAVRKGRRPERVREEMIHEGTISNVYEIIHERKVMEKLIEKAKITKG